MMTYLYMYNIMVRDSIIDFHFKTLRHSNLIYTSDFWPFYNVTIPFLYTLKFVIHNKSEQTIIISLPNIFI